MSCLEEIFRLPDSELRNMTPATVGEIEVMKQWNMWIDNRLPNSLLTAFLINFHVSTVYYKNLIYQV